MMMNIEQPLTYIIWAVIGSLLAIFFIRSQEKTVAIITASDGNKQLAKIFLMSIIRVLLSVSVLLIGFLQSLWLGLTCLVLFLITRWISLLISIKKKKAIEG